MICRDPLYANHINSFDFIYIIYSPLDEMIIVSFFKCFLCLSRRTFFATIPSVVIYFTFICPPSTTFLAKRRRTWICYTRFSTDFWASLSLQEKNLYDYWRPINSNKNLTKLLLHLTWWLKAWKFSFSFSTEIPLNVNTMPVNNFASSRRFFQSKTTYP